MPWTPPKKITVYLSAIIAIIGIALALTGIILDKMDLPWILIVIGVLVITCAWALMVLAVLIKGL